MFNDYIFTEPSFLRGVAKVLDPGGVLTRDSIIISSSPAEADRNALASDLRVVSRDMNKALAGLEADGQG